MEESRGPVSETIQCGWYLTPAFQESVVKAGCRRDSLWTQVNRTPSWEHYALKCLPCKFPPHTSQDWPERVLPGLVGAAVLSRQDVPSPDQTPHEPSSLFLPCRCSRTLFSMQAVNRMPEGAPELIFMSRPGTQWPGLGSGRVA